MSIQPEAYEELCCQNCNGMMIRLKRRALMRMIASSRHVYCQSCQKRYLKIGALHIHLGSSDIFLS